MDSAINKFLSFWLKYIPKNKLDLKKELTFFWLCESRVVLIAFLYFLNRIRKMVS